MKRGGRRGRRGRRGEGERGGGGGGEGEEKQGLISFSMSIPWLLRNQRLWNAPLKSAPLVMTVTLLQSHTSPFPGFSNISNACVAKCSYLHRKEMSGACSILKYQMRSYNLSLHSKYAFICRMCSTMCGYRQYLSLLSLTAFTVVGNSSSATCSFFRSSQMITSVCGKRD